MDIVEYDGISALVDIVNNGNPTAKANAAFCQIKKPSKSHAA
jgi:hypothetical protein